MRFRAFYDSLEKKEKLFFSVIVSVALFSILFTMGRIFFVGLKYMTMNKETLPIGRIMPDIPLKNEKGMEVNWSEGPAVKKLLLFYKPKCRACRMELSNLQYISRQYPPEQIKIIAVSEAEEKETRNFLQTYAVNFPMLMDTEKSFRKLLKFFGTPILFLVDENNIIKYARVGYTKLEFDKLLIKEFLQSAKVPIETLGPEDALLFLEDF